MQKAPIPSFEEARLCAVGDLKLLDTANEERFDRITKKALERFAVPISTITIVDRDREWFKSVQGLANREGPRDVSFCGHALLAVDILVLEDTLDDPRFADNPMVIGSPFIRFYAGRALREDKSQLPVGVFCIKDQQPRKMSLKDIDDFLLLAEEAEQEINRHSGGR